MDIRRAAPCFALHQDLRHRRAVRPLRRLRADLGRDRRLARFQRRRAAGGDGGCCRRGSTRLAAAHVAVEEPARVSDDDAPPAAAAAPFCPAFSSGWRRVVCLPLFAFVARRLRLRLSTRPTCRGSSVSSPSSSSSRRASSAGRCGAWQVIRAMVGWAAIILVVAGLYASRDELAGFAGRLVGALVPGRAGLGPPRRRSQSRQRRGDPRRRRPLRRPHERRRHVDDDAGRYRRELRDAQLSRRRARRHRSRQPRLRRPDPHRQRHDEGRRHRSRQPRGRADRAAQRPGAGRAVAARSSRASSA